MKKKNKNSNLLNKLQGSNLWKNQIIKRLFYTNFKKIFLLGQKLGIHITPNHYYYPIPDTRTLTARVFSRKTNLSGIDINEEKQLELLSIFESRFREEYEKIPRDKPEIPYQYYTTNGNFKSVDGEILYCMIRYFKPRRIIEIGSGYSTFCSAQAINKNKELDNNYECEFIAIEPYPNEIIRRGFPGLTKLIPKKLQDVPFSEFEKLNENDILFIDSTHILAIGGDVQHEYLEILPRLNNGVMIHVHDILLPLEYPPEYVLGLLRFWTEQYLLQAFLMFNNNFQILWMSKYMHLKHPDDLENTFNSLKLDKLLLNQTAPNYYKENSILPIGWPCSFWMKRIK